MSDSSAVIAETERVSAPNYSPLPVVVSRGEGVWVWDLEGRRYLDCISAYSSLNQGHRHPRIVAALVEQAGRLTLTSRAVHNDEMGPFLKSLPTTLVFDHMGCPDVKEGVEGNAFQKWLDAIDQNKTWITKVTCPERLSVSGPAALDGEQQAYRDVVPFARRVVEEFSDRVLWGTDWPHPNLTDHMPDDGLLVDGIPHIAPTPELQRKLLVDNPMRLYWPDVP